MDDTFNVGNPTKENIDYAFNNLIFYITASTQLDIYKDQKDNFKKVLVDINTILATYVNETLFAKMFRRKFTFKYNIGFNFIIKKIFIIIIFFI